MNKKNYHLKYFRFLIPAFLILMQGVDIRADIGETGDSATLFFPFDLKLYTTVTPSDNMIMSLSPVCECSSSSSEITTFDSWQKIYFELETGSLNSTLFPDFDSIVFPRIESYRNSGIIPIGVINARYSTIKESALTSGLISFDPLNPFISASADPEDLIEEKNAMVIAILVESGFVGNLQFVIPDNLYFSNLSQLPVNYTVNFGDGVGNRTVNRNQTVNVTYSTPGSKNVTITANFANKAVAPIVTYTTLVAKEDNVPTSDYAITIRSNVTNFSYSNTKHRDDSGDKYGWAEVEIWCAEGKNDGLNSFDKPLVIIDGFDPIPQRRGCRELYQMAQNWNQTIERLQADCYDIVTVNWVNGADYIQKNSFALVEVLKFINANKKGQNPIVLIGPSMGGIIGRYALSYMEKNNITHNVGTFIADDSPHRGANIPLSLQKFFEFYAPASGKAKEAFTQISSPASKQLLLYYLDTKPTSLRTTLLTELNNLGNYPVKPYKIAIASGSGLGKSQFNLTGSAFNPGSTFYKMNSKLLGKKVAEATLKSVGNNTTVTVLDAMKVEKRTKTVFNPFLGFPTKTTYLAVVTKDYPYSGTQPLDNCPGGYYPNWEQLRNESDYWYQNDTKELFYEFFTFIPMISAIDLDHSITNLFYTNPTAAQTPFNMIIYTQQPAQNNGVYEMPAKQYAWNEEHCWITKTKQDALMAVVGNAFPPTIVIQNETMTSNTGYAYSIQAKNNILAGSAVDPSRTSGMVNIMGNYKFTAGTNIVFKPGFKVYSGYPFIAKINSPEFDCGYTAKNYPLNTGTEDIAEEDLSEDFLFSDGITDENNGLMVFPNPAQEKVSIQFTGSEVFQVQILNMNGAVLFNQEVNCGLTEVHTDSFDPGIYLVKVSSGNEVFIRRLMIN